jgi:hypothetical protein
MGNINLDKIEKWYESRITFTIFTMGIAISAVLFVIIPMYQMKTDIAVLQTNLDKVQNNELVHIKTQLDQNAIDHTQMEIMLGKIMQKLDIK